jgi:EAL domain-containing protein (putative c-di-GMP-specific phosphodiesterase class I)
MNKKNFRWTVLLPALIGGLVVTAILAFQLVRHFLIEENEALVHTVAQSMLPALLVNDSHQIEAMMRALESYPGVQTAELVNAQGAALASYARGVDQSDAIAPVFALATALDDPNQLHVISPITFDSLVVANLHISVNLWPIYLRIMTWLGLLLIVPSVAYVVVRQLRIKVRFETISSHGGPGSGSDDRTFDLHGTTSKAMADADISLEYQPIRRLSDGGLFGMEVVACWRHPSGQTLHFSPANFVSLAEKANICLPFDIWLLRTAFEKAAVWQRQHGPLVLTLDVSEAQFNDPLFPQTVRDLCDSAQYPNQLLELEVRESILSRQPMVVTAAMRAFAAKGLNLTVDGFGLMQSSLQLLQDFPIHKIKLDGKLIKNLLNDTHVSLLIQDTVSYALARDVQVTTEGIESSQQCTEVEKMGCLLGQGAYLSQPLAVNDFEILLSGQAHNRVQLRHSQENSETLKGFSSI